MFEFWVLIPDPVYPLSWPSYSASTESVPQQVHVGLYNLAPGHLWLHIIHTLPVTIREGKEKKTVFITMDNSMHMHGNT